MHLLLCEAMDKDEQTRHLYSLCPFKALLLPPSLVCTHIHPAVPLVLPFLPPLLCTMRPCRPGHPPVLASFSRATLPPSMPRRVVIATCSLCPSLPSLRPKAGLTRACSRPCRRCTESHRAPCSARSCRHTTQSTQGEIRRPVIQVEEWKGIANRCSPQL